MVNVRAPVTGSNTFTTGSAPGPAPTTIGSGNGSTRVVTVAARNCAPGPGGGGAGSDVGESTVTVFVRLAPARWVGVTRTTRVKTWSGVNGAKVGRVEVTVPVGA